jgi:hypothetical protein
MTNSWPPLSGIPQAQIIKCKQDFLELIGWKKNVTDSQNHQRKVI